MCDSLRSKRDLLVNAQYSVDVYVRVLGCGNCGVEMDCFDQRGLAYCLSSKSYKEFVFSVPALSSLYVTIAYRHSPSSVELGCVPLKRKQRSEACGGALKRS